MTTAAPTAVTVVVSSVLTVHGASLSVQAHLQKRYTYTPTVPPGAPQHVRPQPTTLARTCRGLLVLPRDLRVLADPDLLGNARVIDAQDDRPCHMGAFRGSLDETRNQPVAVDACMRSLRANALGGGCLLSLPPGFGKTACALHISSLLGKRTLILVHTTVLAEQWRSRISAFLPGAKTVVLSAPSAKSASATSETTTAAVPPDTTHVVALLQTVLALNRKHRIAWLEEWHGLVIVDETHHICAKTLCRVMEIVGGRYRLGLSATVERKDGLHDMLESLIGPMAYRCLRDTAPNLEVRAVKYYGNAPIHAATFVEHVNELAEDPERLEIVGQLVESLYHDKHQKRYMLVLSDRLRQLWLLRDWLHARSISTHAAVGGCTATPDMALRPVILATYQYASEGMDVPLLNTCVMASPRVDVKQSVGRILRASGNRPLVVDIVDMQRYTLRRQFEKRRKFYTNPLDQDGLAATLTYTDFS